MKYAESILRPVKKIHGCMKLNHNKNTAECETVIMPPPQVVYIPLTQHIGAPCTVSVEKGDTVFVGTKIGESGGYVSAPIYSSVSGTVADIGERNFYGSTVQCVTIESDGKMTNSPDLKPFEVNNSEDIANAAKMCGLVGLGGAGFPTHVKLSPPKDVKIDTLIINAAECEPYLTADYRESMENYDDIIEGVYLLKDKLGIDRVVIGVESNKPKSIDKLMQIASDHRDFDDKVKVMKLPSSYPQGAEKVIIYSATGRALPAGKLPSDVGCIVMNITSVGVLYRFIKTGMPLVSKRVTVDGTQIEKPMNVKVPIGTPIKDVLEFVGFDTENADKILLGGPMMGVSVSDVNTVVEKRTNGILVMKSDDKPRKTTACIRCGRCADSCPMGLYPSMVEANLNKGFTDKIKELNVTYCMECGCCSYICPSKRPLTQVMRTAKQTLRREKK